MYSWYIAGTCYKLSIVIDVTAVAIGMIESFLFLREKIGLLFCSLTEK